MMIIFIHVTDYSVSILEDRCAVYSIYKLPVISVVGRRNEFFFFFYIDYRSNTENFQTIKTVLEVSQVNRTMQFKCSISGYS